MGQVLLNLSGVTSRMAKCIFKTNTRSASFADPVGTSRGIASASGGDGALASTAAGFVVPSRYVDVNPKIITIIHYIVRTK